MVHIDAQRTRKRSAATLEDANVEPAVRSRRQGEPQRGHRGLLGRTLAHDEKAAAAALLAGELQAAHAAVHNTQLTGFS